MEQSPATDINVQVNFNFPYTVQKTKNITLSPPESAMETFKAVLTFESEDEILRFDHSNETSSAVFSHGNV